MYEVLYSDIELRVNRGWIGSARVCQTEYFHFNLAGSNWPHDHQRQRLNRCGNRSGKAPSVTQITKVQPSNENSYSSSLWRGNSHINAYSQHFLVLGSSILNSEKVGVRQSNLMTFYLNIKMSSDHGLLLSSKALLPRQKDHWDITPLSSIFKFMQKGHIFYLDTSSSFLCYSRNLRYLAINMMPRSGSLH